MKCFNVESRSALAYEDIIACGSMRAQCHDCDVHVHETGR